MFFAKQEAQNGECSCCQTDGTNKFQVIDARGRVCALICDPCAEERAITDGCEINEL